MSCAKEEWDYLTEKQRYGMISRLLVDVQELKNKVYGLEEDMRLHKLRDKHPDI